MVESVLKESRKFFPPKSLAKEAHIESLDKYKKMCKAAEKDFEKFWDILAKEKLEWDKEYTKVLDSSNAPFYKWFAEGKLNISYHCIDRHLANNANKIAIIYENERGESKKITYKTLNEEVNRFANLLVSFGIKKGDRVILYMSMIPQLPIAMLACARIGAIHSVVFAGFSAQALRDRIVDAKAKIIITCDGGYRKGKIVNIKNVVDEAVKGLDFVEKILVYDRKIVKTETNKKDVAINNLLANMKTSFSYIPLDSEDCSFILYTSGSTGKPKGVQHSVGGYLLWAILTMEWVFDIKENDIFWCSADIGWIQVIPILSMVLLQ